MYIFYYNHMELIQSEGENFMKKKALIIVIALILVAAVAVATVLILAGGDDGPVEIYSVSYHDRGEQAISSYLYFSNNSDKKMDDVFFSIQLYAGKDLIKQFNHTHNGYIDPWSFSAESVWHDFFSSSEYTYSDITKVKVAVTGYKFYGEEKVTINKPVWKSY